MKNYDIAIVGTGLAGVFAAKRIAQSSNLKCVMFDLGRPMGKRRRQCEGWFGAFPNSDGKFYMADAPKVGEVIGNRKLKTAQKYVLDYLEKNLGTLKVQKDRKMNVSLEKKITKLGFAIESNDFIQFFPKDIHLVSKQIATELEESGNVTFSFDNEVNKIFKQKGGFCLQTSEGEFFAKRVLIASGRSGWRWVGDVFKHFGIIDDNDTASFGIHGEISSSYMKDFNKSNCTLTTPELEIGPFSWGGTIIPEDHVDLAISAFRSNENRWKTDKVSFKIIGHRPFKDAGVQQTDRLGKLAWLLSNDRVSKERVSALVAQRSKVSVLPEYDWLVSSVKQISEFIPNFATKGYFHVPTIQPTPPKIVLGSDLSTEVEGLFVAGENTGIHGLLAASLTGVAAGDGLQK